jgi:hypothetical protein
MNRFDRDLIRVARENNQNLPKVRRLLVRAGADVNAEDNQGRKPLSVVRHVKSIESHH